MWAGQIRTSQKLSYGIVATLKVTFTMKIWNETYFNPKLYNNCVKNKDILD